MGRHITPIAFIALGVSTSSCGSGVAPNLRVSPSDPPADWVRSGRGARCADAASTTASGRTADLPVDLRTGELSEPPPPGSTVRDAAGLFAEGWAAVAVDNEGSDRDHVWVLLSKPESGNAPWRSALFVMGADTKPALLGASPGAPSRELQGLLDAGWWVQSVGGNAASAPPAIVARAPVAGESPCHSALLDVMVAGSANGQVHVIASSDPQAKGPRLNDWTADPANPWMFDARARSFSIGPYRRLIALLRSRP